MSLDHATIRRIASLARIRVEEHEVEHSVPGTERHPGLDRAIE